MVEDGQLAAGHTGHRGADWRVAAGDVLEVDLHHPQVLELGGDRDPGVLVPGAVEEAGGQDPVQPLLVEPREKCQEMREVGGRGKVRDLRPLRLEAVLDELGLELARKDRGGVNTEREERTELPVVCLRQSVNHLLDQVLVTTSTIIIENTSKHQSTTPTEQSHRVHSKTPL